jgi:hypothetical protein
MIARKQEISLQLNQLIDALLLDGILYLSHLVTARKLAAHDSAVEVSGFCPLSLDALGHHSNRSVPAGTPGLLQLPTRKEPSKTLKPNGTGGILALGGAWIGRVFSAPVTRGIDSTTPPTPRRLA